MHFFFLKGLFIDCLLTALTMSLSSKKIAVVGGGSVGSTLANSMVAGGTTNVVIAARDPPKTKAALAEKKLEHLEVQPVDEAIKTSDILVLAVPGGHTDEDIEKIAQSLGDDVKGKVVIDATNPLTAFENGLQVRWSQGTSGAETLQKYLPEDTKVYKAFNTLGVELMFRPRCEGVDMLFCGPDDGIADVVTAVGFTPRYVGTLRYARNLEAMAELWIHCAIPPLGGQYLGRDWSFALEGNIEK